MALSFTISGTRTNDLQSCAAVAPKPAGARNFSLLTGAVLLCAALAAQPSQAQAPAWQWAAQSNGSGIGQLKSLAVDAEGNSYQAGFFTETIRFGRTTLVSQGRSDIFVAKLSSAGTWEWAVAVGSAGSDNAAGVAIDAAGRIFVSGSFSNEVHFGPTALASQGDMDVFVAQISPQGTWTWATAAGGSGLDRNWLKLLATFYPEAALETIANWFIAQEIPPHFTLVFTLALQRVGFELEELKAMYLHMLLRDQLSAAIRLGFLGPLEGHQLQHDFYAVFEHILAAQAGKGYSEAVRSAFLLDVAQVLHEDIYSKLFQN